MSQANQKSGFFFLSIFLCLTCAFATALMCYVYSITKAPIEMAKSRKVADGLKLVLPPFTNNPVETATEVTIDDGRKFKIFLATNGDKVVGYAVESYSDNGYGGRINGLIGFHPDTSIRTVIITSHNETPGLGTKVTDRVRKRTIVDLIKRIPVDPSLPTNAILDQFAGRNASGAASSPWLLKKDGGDVDFVTGATISSRATADLVSAGAAALARHNLKNKEQ